MFKFTLNIFSKIIFFKLLLNLQKDELLNQTNFEQFSNKVSVYKLQETNADIQKMSVLCIKMAAFLRS